MLQDEVGGATSLRQRFKDVGMFEIAEDPEKLARMMDKIKSGKAKVKPRKLK